MLQKFINIIKQNNLIKENDKVIMGLSGGPDSVCLLSLLSALKEHINFTLIVAHLDHGWRKTSQQDVLFCKQLAEKYNIPFIAKHASEITLKKKLYGSSKEELGRALRRQLFVDLFESEQADSIALAHHCDDQAETYFIRLMRGTTITGLSCMKPKQDIYIRPLLDFTKAEILAYLKAENLTYLIDETNDSDIFLRNKIRKYLIPTAQTIDPRFDKNLKKAIDSFQETNEFIAKLANKALNDITLNKNNNYLLDLNKFFELDPYLHKQVIILWLCKYQVQFPISNAFLTEILKFFKKQGSGIHKIHQEWSIIKDKHYVYIFKS